MYSLSQISKPSFWPMYYFSLKPLPCTLFFNMNNLHAVYFIRVSSESKENITLMARMFLNILSCCTKVLCSSGNGHNLLNWPTANDRTNCHISSLVSTDLFTSHWENKRYELLTAESFVWSSASHILHNPKVHYYMQKSPPFAPVLNHMNPVHTPLKSHFSTQYILISSWCSMQLYPSSFQPKPVYISHQHATWLMNCPLPCPWTNPLTLKADQTWCAVWC